VQRAIKWQAVRHSILRGHGGALVFLWVLGSGFFLVVWGLPEYAAIWTATSLLFGVLIARDSLRDPQALALAGGAALGRRFPLRRLAEPRHRDAVQKAVRIFLEVLLKIEEIERSRALDEDLAASVSDIERLLSMQYESARQAEEAGRILRLIEPDGDVGGRVRARGLRHSAAAADAGRLHQRNIAAIRHQAAQAEAAVDEIGQRLETLLLQALQMEKQAIEVVAAMEARAESADALERLQQAIDARSSAARQLMELVGVDLPAGPR
jgi:hypothetical protein